MGHDVPHLPGSTGSSQFSSHPDIRGIEGVDFPLFLLDPYQSRFIHIKPRTRHQATVDLTKNHESVFLRFNLS